MTLRMLDAADADAFRSLRLEALLNAPAAFASSYEEEVARSLAGVAERLTPGHDGFTLGAFVEGRLIGTVGVRRMPHGKERHKALMWGMYVTPGARGRGVGRRLAEAALDHAATMPGLRQVVLGVGAENGWARRIYDALGFEAFGLERHALIVDGVGHDEVHMVRRVGT
jgi:RimJ/RimL family protein N-acetyltransferase